MNHLTKQHWILIAFNLLYLVPFTLYYVAIGNYEFLWYISVLVIFFVLILGTIHKSNFTPLILWGLSLWSLLHMLGGGVKVAEGVLYSKPLIPLFEIGGNVILKYDQVVHAFGFFIATLVMHHILKPYLNEKTNWNVVYLVVWAAGMGLGALNEVVEFIAVVMVPDTNVGGYYNTAIDLIANMIGAALAVLFIHLRKDK